MQILTARQVEYCHLIVNKSAQTLYMTGLSFQDKLFVRDRVFACCDRQIAIQYCETMYLANKGSKSYLLLEEGAKLTVWLENKSARIIGSKSPEDVIHELKLANSVVAMQNMRIDISDRQLSIDREADKNPIENLKTSLDRAISLGQKLMN